MSGRTYAVRFDFPEADAPFYAGLAGSPPAFGFAPTLATAELYPDADTAARVRDNAYGPSARQWARVVLVTAGGGS